MAKVAAVLIGVFIGLVVFVVASIISLLYTDGDPFAVAID